jgi:hypothetical protein
MVRRALIVFISITAFNCAYAERYALLVGNANAKGAFSPLKYVENDLAGLKAILGDFCGFDKRNIVTLYNGAPEDLNRLLSEFSARTSQTKSNLFLFYFSGHADQASLKMGDAPYPLDTLKEKLTAFPSDIRIGIFDACQSGSFTRIKGGTLSEPFLFKDDGKTKGHVFLSSSSISENSQEFDAYQNSIFTFHFINALRGSGDLSGDGRVTLSEAYQYAYNHTVSSTAGSSGGIQHPSYQFKIQGEGDIVLADLNVRSQGILLGQGVWGDMTIFNEQSGVVADFSKKKNSAVLIALGRGAYRIVQAQYGARLEATVALEGNNVVTVKQDNFSTIESHSAGKKGITERRHSAQAGVCFAGVYQRLDLSSLASGLSERFQGYRYFSIVPSFSFPSSARYAAITGEVIAREHYVGRLGFSAFSFSSTADYHGRRLNELDNTTYGYALHTESKLSVFAVDFGAGYRWNSWYLRRFSLLVGLNIYEATLEVSSLFKDSLYNVALRGTEIDRGTIAVPYISAGYAWPITNFCEVGAELRYRYQRGAQELSNQESPAFDTLVSSAPAPLKCNFRGFDCRLYVNFNLKFGNME